MTYTHTQHKHNFSVWVAARAAQRGFSGVRLLRGAINVSHVRAFAENPSSIQTARQFDRMHRKWCSRICLFLQEQGVQKVTYGRAAKMVAVYLKSMVVLTNPDSIQAGFIHPPIDRILLQNIAKRPDLPGPKRLILKRSSWTKFDELEYFTVLRILRKLSAGPLWKLEEFWG